MKKQVYEINEKGMLIKILIAEIDGNGNPLEDLGENIVITDPPNGLYRAKWTSTEWVEDITQEEIDELKKPTPEQEIVMLKSKLEETDYMIIKCYEYQLVGLESPYDIEALHAKRQPIRNRINELELLTNEH